MDNTLDISHLIPDFNISSCAALTGKSLVTIVDPIAKTNDTIATSRDIPDIIKRYAGEHKELLIYTGVSLSDSVGFNATSCTLVIFGKNMNFSIQCTFMDSIYPIGEIYTILKRWITEKDELNNGDNNSPYEYTVNGHIYQYDPWFEDIISYKEPLTLEGYPSLLDGIEEIARLYEETGDTLIKIRRDMKPLDDEAEECWLTLEVTENEGKLILGAEDNETRVSITGDFLSFHPAQIAYIHDGLISRSLPTRVNK